MFRVGMKVILIGWIQSGVDTWKAGHPSAQYPNVGDVYTVRAIRPWKDTAVLLLGEVDNSHLGYMLEPGFRQSFFRPVIERKTDTSVFTAMLKPSKVTA